MSSLNQVNLIGNLGKDPEVRTFDSGDKVANFSAHPDWTLRVCDNFDWWAPKYQSHHTVAELSAWFADEGFDEIAELFPEKSGGLYRWVYEHDLIIGSGVNVTGVRRG